jgi:hypothetical protein
MKLSILPRLLTVAVTGTCLLLVVRPPARSAGSLSDTDIEYRELKVAFDKVLGDNQKLKSKLAETEKALADSRNNLAAGGEEGLFQRKYLQLRKRMEALGIDGISGGESKLEQRLLTAVSDLRVAAKEKKQLTEALVRLSEASAFYAKHSSGTNPQARLALEVEIRNAASALGVGSSNAVEAAAVPATVTDGSVISVVDKLALVVMNIGATQGVKSGMPFLIIRDDKVIGTVRVVEPREKISGAVIQNLVSEKDRIKIGDRLRVDAQP